MPTCGRAFRLTALAISLAALLGGCSHEDASTSPLQAWSEAPAQLRALLWPEPRPLGQFALETQHGAAFGPKQFDGQWSFLFFGFPDVCPTTLSAMRELRRSLIEADPKAASYRFVFVSVDPEVDSAEAMTGYLSHFDPDFIGLRGESAALKPLLDALAVMAVPVTDENTGVRSFDHTSSVMLINPQGQAVGALPPPHNPQRMLEGFLNLRAYLDR